MRSFTAVVLLLPVLVAALPVLSPREPQTQPAGPSQGLLQGMSSPFVPNLGQWPHQGKFIHRAGPMTVFLEDRGWVLDLVEPQPKVTPDRLRPFAAGNVHKKVRGVALRMTFEGDAYVPEIVGEQQQPGHHNYFLGNDEGRWRTGVPLFASVRYQGLYPGIDLRLREVNGVPEYDLLLEPGADLLRVNVHVEGGQGLSIAGDGSLVIGTELGPLTQPRPRTFEVGRDGRQREVACQFTLLGPDRFGFLAPGWAGDTSLTIDPGLIWSTFLGGSGNDFVLAMSVDANGAVTVAGTTASSNFPTITGAYAFWHAGVNDAFVSRLDPSKTGNAQLVYSTFLGGNGDDRFMALSVDASGVVTIAGGGDSGNFPTTTGAWDTTPNGGRDGYVARLDPRKAGSAQLVYSTSLGGSSVDQCQSLAVDASGVMTVSGMTMSTNFPTTAGAYNTTYNGGNNMGGDALVSRLDPSKPTTQQLVYSTYLGGSSYDHANGLAVDASGVVTVGGLSFSSNYPTTSGAYATIHSGGLDVFASRLDPNKSGSAQCTYSTFLGGNADDGPGALSVDASGVVTVAGATSSGNFPATGGAYDTTYNGPTSNGGDAFVSRLDMGVPLYGDVHEVSLSTGGAQKLTVNAGPAHKGRSYWIFGSVTGTTPGVTLGSAIGPVHIPLNPDVWTDYTIALANTPTLKNTKATLDGSGTAAASFNIPKVNLPSAIGLVFHHACLVYDDSDNFYLASNAVPLELVK